MPKVPSSDSFATCMSIQEALYEHSVDVLSSSTKLDRSVLANATYAKAVLKESFRMSPVAVSKLRYAQSFQDGKWWLDSGMQEPRYQVIVGVQVGSLNRKWKCKLLFMTRALRHRQKFCLC